MILPCICTHSALNDTIPKHSCQDIKFLKGVSILLLSILSSIKNNIIAIAQNESLLKEAVPMWKYILTSGVKKFYNLL